MYYRPVMMYHSHVDFRRLLPAARLLGCARSASRRLPAAAHCATLVHADGCPVGPIFWILWPL